MSRSVSLDELRAQYDPDAFLRVHENEYIQCSNLKASIRRSHCEDLQKLPKHGETVDMATWRAMKGTKVGSMFSAGMRRPFGCEGCKHKIVEKKRGRKK